MKRISLGVCLLPLLAACDVIVEDSNAQPFAPRAQIESNDRDANYHGHADEGYRRPVLRHHRDNHRHQQPAQAAPQQPQVQPQRPQVTTHPSQGQRHGVAVFPGSPRANDAKVLPRANTHGHDENDEVKDNPPQATVTPGSNAHGHG